jgi:phosphoglycolate phosphatase
MKIQAETIKAVLWDKDGTLLDNFSVWIRRERSLLETLCTDLEITENLRSDAVESGLVAIGIHGGRVDPHGELAGGTEASICDAMAEALSGFARVPEPEDFRRLVNGHLHEILACDTDPPPLRIGVTDALTAARNRGLPQGLATSDSRKSAVAEIAPYGLAEFFSYFSFGDEALRPKPDPWCILEFSRITGIPAGSIIFVGDSPVDEATAKAAGAGFCAVLGGAGGRGDFSPETLIAAEPEELVSLLAGKI